MVENEDIWFWRKETGAKRVSMTTILWVLFGFFCDEHFWCQVWRTLLLYFQRYMYSFTFVCTVYTLISHCIERFCYTRYHETLWRTLYTHQVMKFLGTAYKCCNFRTRPTCRFQEDFIKLRNHNSHNKKLKECISVPGVPALWSDHWYASGWQ